MVDTNSFTSLLRLQWFYYSGCTHFFIIIKTQQQHCKALKHEGGKVSIKLEFSQELILPRKCQRKHLRINCPQFSNLESHWKKSAMTLTIAKYPHPCNSYCAL